MNLVNSQDTELKHQNLFYSYILTMKNQKEKLRTQSHSPLQQKRIQYPGITYLKRQKTCMQKTIYTDERNQRWHKQMERYSMFLDWKNQYWKSDYTAQSNLRIQCNPYQTTCLLRNLYAGQEATVRTRYGTKDWFKIGKGICQGCILSPCLFVYMLSTSCEMPGWMKHKLESRFPGKIQSSQICRWYYQNCRKQRGTKEPLDEDEREKKAG